MAPAKRPEPLSEELMEPGLPAGGKAALLLGRTAGPAAAAAAAAVPGSATAAKKGALTVKGPSPGKQQLAPPPSDAPSGLTSGVPTPAGFRHLLTPLGSVTSAGLQPHQWCFTPMATPSPSSRFSAFEQLRLGVTITTPGSKAQPSTTGGLLRSHRGEERAAAAAVAAAQEAWDKVSTPKAEALNNSGGVEADDDEDDGDDDSDDGLLEQVNTLRGCEDAPRPPPGALHPSVGSAGHASGTCKRCCFFPRGRCLNGYDCEFCHYEHEKRKRKNKKNARRSPCAPFAAPSHYAAAMGMPLPTVTAGCHILQPSASHPSSMMMMSAAHPAGALACQAMGGAAHSLLTAALPGHSAIQVLQQHQSCYLPGGAAQYAQLAAGGYLVQQPQMVLTMPAAAAAVPPPQQQQVLTLEPALMPRQQQQCRPRATLAPCDLIPPPPPPAHAPGTFVDAPARAPARAPSFAGGSRR